MSIEVMERCRLLPIRGWPKAILMLLAYHHNPKTGQCDPSVETLAVESGAHHETVSAALVKLRRLGLISARHRGPTSRAYAIHFEVFDAPGKSRGHFDPKPPEKAEGISTPSPRKNRQMPPEKPANAPGKTGPKPKEPKEPKDDAAAGRSRLAATAQAGRVAPSPDPKSEISSGAAREAELAGPARPAHDSGREGMSAAADVGAPEARQVRTAARIPDMRPRPPARARDPVGDLVRRVAEATGQHEGQLWAEAVVWCDELERAGYSSSEAQRVIGDIGGDVGHGKHGDPLVFIRSRIAERVAARRAA